MLKIKFSKWIASAALLSLLPLLSTLASAAPGSAPETIAPQPGQPASRRADDRAPSPYADPQAPLKRAPIVMGGQTGESWAIFGGLDAGYASLSVDPSTLETSKSGYQLGLKGLASFYAAESPWVVDMGLGWSYTKVSGSSAYFKEENTLRNAYAELSPRYRLGDSQVWQLGPVLDLGFGADLTLSQPYTDNKSIGLYPGIQLVHELAGEASLVRIGGRITTDLSIPDRTLWVAQVLLQVGFPTSRKEAPAPIAPAAPVSREETIDNLDNLSNVPTPTEEVEIRVIGDRLIQVELTKEVTNFGTGSSKLSPRAQNFLNRLGQYLASQPDAWSKLDVEGHTDQRGSQDFNLRLSRRRAEAAQIALEDGGVNHTRFYLAGYGARRPLDPRNNPSAWAKNRRVEVRIDGVDDTKTMTDAIGQIRGDTMGLPDTKLPLFRVSKAKGAKSAKASKLAKAKSGKPGKSAKLAKAKAAKKSSKSSTKLRAKTPGRQKLKPVAVDRVGTTAAAQGDRVLPSGPQ
jgi:peptidoglycan-associated lipoprotein